MNTQNVGSFEACKRLVDAGIVLETDFYWARDSNGWYLRTYGTYERDVLESIPAVSMAEVWRELPCDTIVSKGNETYATTGFNGDNLEVNSINPTDALIDLLIWIRRQK